MKKISFLISALLLPLMAMAQSVSSPDGNITVKFSLADGGVPTYEMSYKNKAVVKTSRLGLELAKEIVMRHLTSPSMLCLLSLQDWLSMDENLRLPDADAERINIPANPRHYWRYRMHMTIEQLMAADEFNANMKEMISQSGRK